MRTQKKLLSIFPLMALLLLCLGLAGCPSTKVIVPPLNDSAAHIRTPGKFVWFDLFSTDMTSDENFYEALFGWDFQRTNDNVARVKTIWYQGRPIGNLIGRDSEPGDSQWLVYMSVGNVDEALEIVTDLGGKEYRPAKDLPNRGRVAIALDPQGAPFAMVTSSSGDPSDDSFKANRWLGAELWTTDVDAAIPFYQAIANYEVVSVNVHEKVQYRMLTTNGKRRAGVVSIPWDTMKPEWVPFIGVDNILAILTRVEANGGTVLVPPDMAIKEGHVAIVADPSGAVFGIQQMK